MIEKHEKTCPYCGGRSPLGTPCSSECETAHERFRARAPWSRRFVYITVAVCVLSMLRNTVPGIVRGIVVIGWAVWLCLSNILMPYSMKITGCEKKTEQRMRTVGAVALILLCAILIFLYTLDSKAIYGILTWMDNLRR